MSKPILAVAAGAFDSDRLIEHFGGEAELRFGPIGTADQVAHLTDGADGLVVTLQPVREALVGSLASSVKVIGRAGVGLDNIDLEAARAAGLSVINQPNYGTNEVASHGVAMLLALQRRLLAYDRYVRQGWQGPPRVGTIEPLDEMVVGLIGCGHIGSAVAVMLRGLVGAVVAHDPFAGAFPDGVESCASLDELLARSDAVSLHVPLNQETKRLLDRDRLQAVRPGALLVNVSRGGLIDEPALAEALHRGQIGGAALDVFETEPLPADSPLLDAPNTLFSPHSAAYSARSSWRLASWTIEDTLAWVTTRDVKHGNLVVKGDR